MNSEPFLSNTNSLHYHEIACVKAFRLVCDTSLFLSLLDIQVLIEAPSGSLFNTTHAA